MLQIQHLEEAHPSRVFVLDVWYMCKDQRRLVSVDVGMLFLSLIVADMGSQWTGDVNQSSIPGVHPTIAGSLSREELVFCCVMSAVI